MRFGVYDIAVQFLRHKRMAIDGGAYKGEWTWMLAREFDRVAAFEPQPTYARSLKIKASDHNGIDIFEMALMDKHGQGTLVLPERSNPNKKATDRSSTVIPDNDGNIKLVPLDSFHFPHCDLIKLNVEGAEHLAISGARETIRHHKPVIVLERSNRKKLAEQYQNSPRLTENILNELGYKMAGNHTNDYCWVPKP